jgi:hypothetical protein
VAVEVQDVVEVAVDAAVVVAAVAAEVCNKNHKK